MVCSLCHEYDVMYLLNHAYYESLLFDLVRLDGIGILKDLSCIE